MEGINLQQKNKAQHVKSVISNHNCSFLLQKAKPDPLREQNSEKQSKKNHIPWGRTSPGFPHLPLLLERFGCPRGDSEHREGSFGVEN